MDDTFFRQSLENGPPPTPDPSVRRTLACTFFVLLAGAGGFLHGYFNSIPSGVTAYPPFLHRFFPEVLLQPPPNNIFCEASSDRLQLFTSCHFIVAAALEGSGLPATLIRLRGRTAAMRLAGVLFAVGALIQAVASQPVYLYLGRMVAGAAVSLGNVAGLLYIAEVSPTASRGWLLNTFQVNLACGIALASICNLSLAFVNSAAAWRWILGAPAFVGSAAAFATVWMPDSPLNLFERGKIRSGELALAGLRAPFDSRAELGHARKEACRASCCLRPWREVLKITHRPQLVLSVLSTTLQQLTGINFVVFWGPQLFINLGFSRKAALLVQCALDAVLLLGALVTVVVVDRCGRRRLLVGGSIVCALCMFAMGLLLTFGTHTWLPWAVFPAAVCFVGSYSVSWGPLGWTYPAEIQDLATTSAGMSITAFCNVALSAVTAQAILPVACHMKEGLFYAFAGVSCVAAATVYYLFPETLGVPRGAPAMLFAEVPAWRRLLPSFFS